MNARRDPHAGQPRYWRGPAPSESRLAAILLHGRGGSAEDMLVLAEEFGASDISYVAPEASGHTWYPYSFLMPFDQNEPHLTSALRLVSRVLDELDRNGMPSARVAIVGFSQGACLALEFVARHPRRYAAIIGFSGGLIGPRGTPREYSGTLDGTPVFLGCSDVDPHIPLERVHETAAVFGRLGAAVDERIYPQMGHTVNRVEWEAARALLAAPHR